MSTSNKFSHDPTATTQPRNRLFENTLKKTIYRVRTHSWKMTIAFALIAGIVSGALYTAFELYQNFATSYANVSLVYPEIANGKYPDSSRFATYDLVSDDLIQEALNVMQAKGIYTNFTAEQLADHFDVYTYADGSVADDVTTLRSEGNNYSFLANEYRITFVQPHDYSFDHIKDILNTPDHSSLFLEALMQSEQRYFHDYYGGINGFSEMLNPGNLDNLDYSEKVSAYKTNINIVLRYLKNLNANSGGFVSTSTGKSLMDIISHYEVLFGERLNQISNFIKSSGVTRDLETLLNKLNIQLEKNMLRYNVLLDKVDINRFAMNTYDHTFTENLIIVATSDRSGLYQARPKTAFDTVVDQYNDAVDESINYLATINDIDRDIDLFSSVSHNTAEYKRLMVKCEELLTAFEEDYNALKTVAIDTVREYLASANENYITYEIDQASLITIDLLAKACVVALLAATVVFILYVAATVVSNRNKVRRKRKLLNRMRAQQQKYANQN